MTNAAMPSVPENDGSRTAEPGEGDTVGPYRLGALLGEGGMGRVYRALGPGDTVVALKVVKSAIACHDTYRRRFEREADVASRIIHRHVVPVLDAGESDGVLYMAQRFVSGGSLADAIQERGPLDLQRAIRVCLHVGSALGALGDAGLVHRDLKPANIMLDEEGAAFVTDFGLAKDREASVLTRPGEALGSMAYMAPEQIRGEPVTAATDVYALGCVMNECLTGKSPFGDRRGMQILWAHLQDQAPDPCAVRSDVPRDVGWAVTRALEKEPERRPPTAMAYARMLQVAAGVPPLSPS